MALLEITNVTKDFGGLEALSNVSMQIKDGDIISLIGPNGAGKTTLFNCITGTMPPTSGSIKFSGRQLVGLPPHEVARQGITRTFQHIVENRQFGHFQRCGEMGTRRQISPQCFAPCL